MIVKVNARGRSFKGLTAYLMNGRDNQSQERVAWHRTGNLHTDDPEAAARFMAWTEKNAEGLKAEAGVSPAGRKAEAGGVYHYSLSWAPGETPEEAHQRQQAEATLDRLGLQRHQYVLVAHNDTAHAHVHVMVNLTDPETGKRASLSFDQTALQEWALEYERTYGLHCENREQNARKRERGEPSKYQDERQAYAEKVRQAYERADSGKAFAAALEAQGLSLAQGRRGGAFVIVDERGDIQKLSRQIEGVSAKDIKARLADIEPSALPVADALAKDRAQAWDETRRQQEQQPWQPEPHEVAKAEPSSPAQPAPAAEPVAASPALAAPPTLTVAQDLPAEVKRDADTAAAWRAAKVKEIEAFYRVAELQEQHRQAAEHAQKKATLWGWVTGQQRQSTEAAEAARKNLENAQWRQAEAMRALDNQAATSVQENQLEEQARSRLRAALEQTNGADRLAAEQAERDAIRAQLQAYQERDRRPDQDHDRHLERD